MDPTMRSMHVLKNQIGGRLVANVVPEQTSKIGRRFMICFHVRTTMESNLRTEFLYPSLDVFDSSILRFLRYTWIYLHLSQILWPFKLMFNELKKNPDFHRFLEHRSNITKFLNEMARSENAGKFGDESQGIIITFYVGDRWAGMKMIEYSSESRRIMNRLKSVHVSIRKSKAKCRCAICLDDFVVSDGVLKMLRCSHVFHIHCLGPWLDHKDVCPICNIHIFY